MPLSVCLSVCLFVCALKGKQLELSSIPNLVHMYSIVVARHEVKYGQKVRGQGHMISMKIVAVARLLVMRAATAVCCCCRRGSACRYDCLCLLVSVNSLRQIQAVNYAGSSTDMMRSLWCCVADCGLFCFCSKQRLWSLTALLSLFHPTSTSLACWQLIILVHRHFSCECCKSLRLLWIVWLRGYDSSAI